VLSHFGLLDLCGFPKDTARYLQAWWTGAPVLHLYPHWNWPGREGETIRVWCYSNAEEVELFVNGRTLGRKPMPRHGHLEWDAAYAPGELAARGYAGGRVVAAASVPTTGAPARIVLTPSRTSVQADGADAVVVNVAVTDEAGRVAPLADNEIVYAITGPGRIAGLGNGDPTSHDPEQGRRRRVFNGWGQAIIQAGREPGEITLRAESRGLLSASLRLAAASCNPRPSVRAMADNQAESAKESNV
jgi:beta-galactosidase